MTEERVRKVVLVADDDRDIADLVMFRLDRSGYEVLQAFDGREALDLALERLPDLCVLDVTMPRLDGYEVTRRLRATDATRSIPIILLTARAQEADEERAFDAGATDYVRKPFSPQDLKSRVQALLERP
jgi:DNA-binding response OmpR family regulator